MEYKEIFKDAKSLIDFQPEIGIILGSGLNEFANEIENQRRVKYSDIKGLAQSTVEGHSGEFVVGEIVEMVAHPDSDHLNICQVKVAADKVVQIVAGAPNAKVGLKTIVVLPGAMMPKGNLIFPSELRGEKSFGMMCSPRELQLPNAPQKRGIIELASSEVVGTAFDPIKHWQE